MQRFVLVLMGLSALVQSAAAADPPMPTFFDSRDYFVNMDSMDTVVADMNGDGIPDLIAEEEGYVEIQFGNGDGTFRSGTSQLLAAFANQILVADVNGDGKMDILLVGTPDSNTQPGGVIVALGNGDGTFQPGVFYQAGSADLENIGGGVVGDFNNDGVPDIAISGPIGVWLYTGNSDGTLNTGVQISPALPSALYLAAADFNGDGNLDIVVDGSTSSTGGFTVLFGNGNATFKAPLTFATNRQYSAVAAGKLTAKGYPGIVLSGDQSVYVSLFFSNGAGGFTGPEYVYLPGLDLTARFGLAIGDLNGDGIPDLAGSGGYVAYGQGGGKFKKATPYLIQQGDQTNSVVLADLRNNGRLDMITNSSYGVSVLLNAGNGVIEDGLWTALSSGAGCGVAGDFNGDGRPDVALSTGTGIQILLGTGVASKPLTPGELISQPDPGCLTSIGDLNGDGIPDLLVPTSAGVMPYLGNGDGTFRQGSVVPMTTPLPYFTAVGDFNHDGKLDFATSGNLFALGNGDGTFQTPIPIVANPPSTGFANIAAGDINNDGWTDIVLVNFQIPYIPAYVMLDNHKGGFTQVSSGTVGEFASQVIMADVNGDGNLDLVIQAAVYLGNGKGQFTLSSTVDYPIEGIYGSFVADVNGDGIPDVGVVTPGTTAIFLGLGDGTFAPEFYIGTGPEPGQVFAVDLHGQEASAGLPDLVIPDGSGGVLVLINTTK